MFTARVPEKNRVNQTETALKIIRDRVTKLTTQLDANHGSKEFVC